VLGSRQSDVRIRSVANLVLVIGSTFCGQLLDGLCLDDAVDHRVPDGVSERIHRDLPPVLLSQSEQTARGGAAPSADEVTLEVVQEPAALRSYLGKRQLATEVRR
jgi:hypothetical protein